MLSLSANWIADFSRGGVEPVWLVEIEARKISDKSAVTFKFGSGGREIVAGYVPAISEVGSVGYKLDPISRAFSANDFHIVFSDDGALRTLVKNYFVKGKKATLKLGTPDTGAGGGTFVTVLVGVIDTLRSEAGQHILTCVDMYAVARRRPITGAWINQNPIAIIKDLLDRSGGSANYYDSASLDYTTYTASVSHFAASRYYQFTEHAYQQKEDLEVHGEEANGLIQDLVGALYGTLAPQETTGKATFSLYNGSKAVDRALTADDIDEVQLVDDVWANIYTRIEVSLGRMNVPNRFLGFGPPNRPNATPGMLGPAKWEYGADIIYRRDDATRQADYAINGDNYINALGAESAWFHGIGGLTGADLLDTDLAGATFRVDNAAINGMTGTRHLFPASTIAAADQVSTARPAYLMVYWGNASVFGVEREIIECDACTIDTTGGRTWAYEMDANGVRSRKERWKVAKYQIKTRNWGAINGGVAGTPIVKRYPQGVVGGRMTRIVDITPAVRLATILHDRFIEGAPIISFRTGLRHFDLQIGDFVTLVDSIFLDHGLDGLDGGTVFEIIQKDLDVAGDSPGIYWQACFVRKASPYTVVPTYTVVIAPPWDERIPVQKKDGTLFRDVNGQIMEFIGGGGPIRA